MSRPTRIAFLSEHASPMTPLGSSDAGGQNVYVDEVSRNLGRLGYQVDVFTRRDSEAMAEIVPWAPGVRVVNLVAGPPTFLPKDDLWPHMPAFRDTLYDFASRHGERYDLVHGNFWMSGWVAAQIKQWFNIPAVQIFHAMGKTKLRHQGASDSSPDERIAVEHEVIKGVDRVIAQCPNEVHELVEDYGAAHTAVALIPSAVNVDTFHPVPRNEARRRLGLDAGLPLVVYVGRMLPRKDVRNIVRAVACLHHEMNLDVDLLLVGGETADPDPIATPEIAVLQQLAADLGVASRVHFTGKRQPETLRDYYSAGDVVVTTPWYEPFGLTPLEGMACGRPVIGSAVGGIAFTVADGITGYLVPPRDPHALACRIHQLLLDEDLRRQMGGAARARVEQEFTWATVARRTADLYHSLLEGSVAPRLVEAASAQAQSR